MNILNEKKFWFLSQLISKLLGQMNGNFVSNCDPSKIRVSVLNCHFHYSPSAAKSSSYATGCSSKLCFNFTWGKFLAWISAGLPVILTGILTVFVRLYIQTFRLTFQSLPVTWCTNSLTLNKCTLCPHCINVFCIYLRTNSDLCHLHYKLIGFYNRDEKCFTAL